MDVGALAIKVTALAPISMDEMIFCPRVIHQKAEGGKRVPMGSSSHNKTLSCNAETKDFSRPASYPVRGWTGKNKGFCSHGTRDGRRVIKVYSIKW